MINDFKNLIAGGKITPKQRILLPIFIFFLAAVVYINIIPNKFVMDDHAIFLSWPEIKNFKALELMQGSYPKRYDFHPVYRPVKGVIHAISYKATNNNPQLYHAQSIIVNALIAVLIFEIVLLIGKKPLLALITASIFAVHPIHTEGVTFMTASFDTIGILFFFASFYLYLKFKDNEKKIIFYIISAIFSLLALLTYEMTLILPLLLIFYDICFRNLTIKKVKSAILYIPYFSIVLLYIGLRTIFQPNHNNLEYYAGGFYPTVLLSLRILVKYVELIFFPVKLTVAQILPGDILTSLYDENSASNFQKIHNQSLLDPVSILAILIIIFSAIIFFYFIRKKPIISFSIAWFYIALLPVSNVLFPLRQIMAERYVYIASFGIILLVCYLIFELYDSKRIKNNYKYLILMAFALVIFLLSVRTITRNLDYRNEISIFKSVAKQDNGGYYAKYYLGKYYYFTRDYDSSIYYLNLFINSKYRDFYKDAYYYQSLSYAKLGKTSEAKIAYENLSKALPNFSKSKLQAIDNLLSVPDQPTIQTSTKLGFKTFNFKDNFSFDYSESWNAKTEPSKIVLTNPANNFELIIEYNLLPSGEPRDGYIKNTLAVTYGKLIQQGVAKIPSAQYAYVRIWDLNGQKIAHFMLFNNGEVIEIFAKNFNPEYQSDFNQFINSINFDPE